VEVPNVFPLGGFDAATFTAEGVTCSFSANTLPLLLLRAGFSVEVAKDAETLVLACRPNASFKELPRAFRDDMLRRPEQNGDWLLSRLTTYVGAERMKAEILAGAIDAPHVRAMLELLRAPAFEAHVVDVAVEVVQAFASAGEFVAARMIATAAATRAPDELRQGLDRLLEALG